MVDGITVGQLQVACVYAFFLQQMLSEKTTDCLMAKIKGKRSNCCSGWYLTMNLFNRHEDSQVCKATECQLPKSVQKIIGDQQDEAGTASWVLWLNCKMLSKEQVLCRWWTFEIKTGNAKSRIEQSLEYLVAHVYSKLDLITEKCRQSDADIIAILTGQYHCFRCGTDRDAVSALWKNIWNAGCRNCRLLWQMFVSKYSVPVWLEKKLTLLRHS